MDKLQKLQYKDEQRKELNSDLYLNFNTGGKYIVGKWKFNGWAGIIENEYYQKFLNIAIKERHKELWKRMLELEENHYKETKKLAKLEAIEFLTT